MARTLFSIRRATLIALLFAPAVRAQSAASTIDEAAPTAAELDQNFDREERKAFDDFIGGFQKDAAPKPIEQLLQFDVINGNLIATSIAPAGGGDHFALGGSPPTAFRLSVAPPEQFQVPMTMFQGHLLRFDATGRRMLSVEILPAPGLITFATTVETPTSSTSIQLIEHTAALTAMDEKPATASLYITVNSEIESPLEQDGGLRLVESTFGELVARHHDDVLVTLGEGLTAVRAMHVLAGLSAKEVAAIFAADRPIDPAIQHDLDAIIAEVRHGGSEAVAAARPKLRKLGAPAVMALARADRVGWSADDTVNVDALSAGLLSFSIDHATALLASRSRLIDLLYSPDVAARREAAVRLERLSHQRIAIDPAVDPYTIAEKIEALRLTLASATTKPTR